MIAIMTRLACAVTLMPRTLMMVMEKVKRTAQNE
jgi:hypothetical protein